jgi:hypothetical protein
MFKTELTFDILFAKSDGRCDILMRSANKQLRVNQIKGQEKPQKALTLDAH